MNVEEQLLAASIRDTFREANMLVTQLHNLAEGNNLYNVDGGDHADKTDQAREMLAYFVNKSFRDIGILAERLELPRLAKEIHLVRSRIKSVTETRETRWDVVHTCPALDTARSYFQSMETMTNGRALTGLGVFETVLKNTGKIILEHQLAPDRETAVSGAVHRVLTMCFPDAVRDPPLAKPIKGYKPDIGVLSLMAAVEYKFARSKEKTKNILDEIYADMKGYGNDSSWRSFYAVIYMTDNFYNQDDIDHMFRLVKADLSWTPYVIVGKSSPKVASGLGLSKENRSSGALKYAKGRA